MVWVIICLGAAIAFGLWCCIRINYPQTKKEDQAKIEQDYSDLMADIAERKARHAIKSN